MQYQKLINLSYDTENQPFKFRTRYLVEIMINHGEYDDNDDNNDDNNNKIKSKMSMTKPISCDYSDSYILVRKTITYSQTRQ